MARNLYNLGPSDDLSDPDLQVCRSFVKEVSDVVKAVSYVRDIHSWILRKKQELHEEQDTSIASFGFTLSVVLINSDSSEKVFQTNPISITFSKKEKMILYIPTLKSYSTMDYSCFSDITIERIQDVIKGNIDSLSDVNIKSKFIQITSLFLCETIRNAEALITIPMCLEIAKVLQESTHEKKQKIFMISKQSIEHLDYYSSQDQDTLSTNYDKDTKNLDFQKYENCVGYILKYMFPMSAMGAVSASRYLHRQFSTKIENNVSLNQLKQDYDGETGVVKEAKSLTNREKILVECYNDLITGKNEINLENLTDRWYNVTLKEPEQNSLEIIGDILNDVLGESA